uniref:Predicted protein n=1 Tax=Physcomitrium patens TaxID=3218 RepID=A9RW12_PHYPA
MAEGSLFEEYLRMGHVLKSNLLVLGHKVADETLVQLTLNELPPSYEDIIQSLTVLDILPTLATISSKLLNKSHRLELHRNRLGEDKALTAQFAKARLYCNKCSIQKEENTVNIVINEHQEAFSAAEDIKIALTEFTKELDKRQHWCLDSGATRHVTGNKNFPETYEPGNHGNVTTVGGEKHITETEETVYTESTYYLHSLNIPLILQTQRY